MGTKERRDRERQMLRDSILAASRGIAAREGWQAVSIRKVAEQIEYSPPTIYEHFDSKEALLIELMREGFRLLLERVRAGDSPAAAPEARILGVARAYWEFAWEYPELYQVMHGLGGVPFCAEPASAVAQAEPPPEAKVVFQFTMDALDALAGGTMSCDDREAAVHILWATLHGLVALTMAGRIDGGRAQAAPLLERAVRDFLAARRVMGVG
ncbi:MAG TPA: TetR/AcrR family transcriptional regulator [Roseiflexaceae bacterium]|nr:TetR/AcrR family transcriptional regulator [Roseiflexaceae bacterium]